jgi:Tfp pilus assembly protein PilE
MSKLKNNQHGFTGIEGVLVLAVIIIIGLVSYMVYNNHKKTTPVATVATTTTKSSTATTPPKTTTTTPDPYAGWKTYDSSLQGLSFKYPATWYATDEPTDNARTYITNYVYNPNDSREPDTAKEASWITTNDTEASASTEAATASGKPICCYLGGDVSLVKGTIASGKITINTYQFLGPGKAPVMEAYWSDLNGKRYVAVSGGGEGGAFVTANQDEIANLKLILPTISFN